MHDREIVAEHRCKIEIMQGDDTRYRQPGHQRQNVQLVLNVEVVGWFIQQKL
ncbi:hypothetical protein D3C87_2005720 [compost metagenome]